MLVFYHAVFLEVCRACQIIPYGLFISQKLCIGNLSDRFLDSWEKELKNTGVNLHEVLIEEYVQKLFQLITHFKSLISRKIIWEDWLSKTRKYLEKLDKKSLNIKSWKSCWSCVRIIQNYILHALHVLIVMMNFLILNIIFLSFVTILLQISKFSIILFI